MRYANMMSEPYVKLLKYAAWLMEHRDKLEDYPAADNKVFLIVEVAKIGIRLKQEFRRTRKILCNRYKMTVSHKLIPACFCTPGSLVYEPKYCFAW
jgi:hypothetical protein